MRRTADEHAVGRKRLTWQYPHHFARREAARGDRLELTASGLPKHPLWQPVQQRLERSGCAIAQPQLQPAPGQQEKHEHGERIEIHLTPEKPLRIEGTRRAHPERDQDAQGDRQIHPEAELGGVAQRAAKEGATGEQQHRQCQYPRSPAQQLRQIRTQVTRQSDVGRVGVHHHLHHAQAGDQPAPEGLARRALALRACRAVVCWQHTITGAAHGLHPARWAGCIGRPQYGGPLTRAANRCTRNARNPAQGSFNGQRTRRAGHAFDHDTRLDPTRPVCAGLAELRPLRRIVQQVQGVQRRQWRAGGGFWQGGGGGRRARRRRTGQRGTLHGARQLSPRQDAIV